ncbi:hypothetical protein [Vibrio phage vB_VmeM-Yong XC32]|nr:hypothetical protein [Vibrio phage vB_VmeM-Yong XC31]QAX96423.1 hypothetical protein [Vibrio phage vB_VmeM-Yong XC32]QAX96740.1 hypothetical protein [Vibrio phage vB_VmeM-Yong MS31]QAX97059.1 hypothetical protein [Vibrio phage vB_VmeM-Yong MS32]
MSINKPTPRAVFRGWQDLSTRALPVVRDELPIHLPRFFLRTQKGPLEDMFVSGSEFLNMYGADSADELKQYFSHQTVAAVTAIGNANAVYIKRITGTGAAKSRLVLTAEVVTAEFEEYQRSGDGSLVTDLNGDPLTNSGVTFDGTLIRWAVRPVTELEAGAIANQTPGTLVGKVGEQSTIYPILEFEASHIGEYGNNIGFRMSVPHSKSAEPADAFVVEDQKTMMYRFELLQRAAADRTAVVVPSQLAERSIDVSFKSGVTNTNTAVTFEIDRLVENWNLDEVGSVPRFGPLGQIYVYEDNIEAILTQAKAAEDAESGVTIEDIHQVNIFTAIGWDGNNHETVRISDDSIDLNSVTTHYLQGGSDGSMTDADYDEKVRTELETGWENPDNPVQDALRFPFSCMYDTGFSLDTKKAMLNCLGVRPDIHVGVCTHIEGTNPNDLAAESSVGQVLLQAARLTPESSVYGTGVCRATITRSVGTWSDSVRKRTVPLLIDLIDKRSKYLGAGNGVANATYSYDEYPAKLVAKVLNPTNTYTPSAVKDNFWDLGVNGVEYLGRQEIGWPAIQTVYENSTSVLNSDIVMQLMVDVTKQAHLTWAQTSGGSKDTDAQYFQKVQDSFNAKVEGRYDSRLTIRATAYKTPEDKIRGYSSSMDIEVYADVMRTVQQFNIIARRRSDLTA